MRTPGDYERDFIRKDYRMRTMAYQFVHWMGIRIAGIILLLGLQGNRTKAEVPMTHNNEPGLPSPRVEKIAEGYVFPEGPVWHPGGYLLFSDVHGGTIEKVTATGERETWIRFEGKRKTNGLILDPSGRKLYACGYGELSLLEIDVQSRDVRILSSACNGIPFNNVNDVAVDTRGNIFFSDPRWGAKPGEIQGVYRVNASDGSTTLAAALDKQPNGLVVSPDQKWLYVARSGAHDIYRFQLHPDGTLSDGKVWVNLEKGDEPDGMTVDASGNLYVAQAGNGKLRVLSPAGKTLHLIPIFEKMCTNCEFAGTPPGGAGDGKVLYVTGGGRQGSHQGAVYRVTF